MLGSTSEVRTNSWATFSYGLLHMDTTVLVDQQRIIFIRFLLTWCHLKNIPRATTDKDIRGAFNIFPDFFVQAFKIIVDSWKFSMLSLYILWDDWPILMISGSNEQLLQELEYTLLKPDCHSWWISKMQPGREDTLEEQYAIKLCFKLGKNATKTYGMLQTAFRLSCMNRASLTTRPTSQHLL